MTNVLKVIVGTFFAVLFLALSAILFDQSRPLLAIAFAIISIASCFVWFLKKNLTYRFLYPGMLAFLLFTILPIIFSVYISFTNLGTGHFFSQEKVKRILLSAKKINGKGLALPFSLYPSHSTQGTYTLQLKVDDAFYQAHLGQEKVIPLRKVSSPLTERPLPVEKVFKERNLLQGKSFTLPNGDIYLYHRVDKLIQGEFIYREGEGDTIINKETGAVFSPDDHRGRYVSQKDNGSLEPGFYTFVGLKNFTDLFGKEEFRKTFLKVSVWTFIWALVSVILTFSLGLSLALFIHDKNLKFKAIYRNLLILPYSIPFFISVLVFKGMLNKDFGVVNSFLATVGIDAIPWLENGLWAKISCLMVNLWLGFPYMFLLTTGILQSIPESVYEAAKIDGANKWQSFRSITLPLILSSITPLLIGAFAFNLGNFVGIYLLTGGGPAMADATTPAGQTDILISYTYRLAFEGAMGQQFGLASSIALFIFIIIGALTAINFKIFNKEQEL